MEEVNFSEYKKNLIAVGISEKDIYDFKNDQIKGVYQNYFDWCIDNLREWRLPFKLDHTFFYYWDTHIINSYAAHDGKGNFFIRFTRGYMDALHKKLGTKGNFIGKTNWIAFQNLQKQIPVSLEYLMFQASTIFTFYHEFAHLIQKHGIAFQMNEHPESEDFNFENHIYEYDADLNGCSFVYMYIHQFIEDSLPTQFQTQNNIKRLMYLGVSSIIINFLLFLHGELYPYKPDFIDTSFYVKKSTHPHTYIRAKYSIEHYVVMAKANGINIDYRDTVRNVKIICTEFFKDSGIFDDFLDGMNENFIEIQKYSFELDDAQNVNPNCIRHKVGLFS